MHIRRTTLSKLAQSGEYDPSFLEAVLRRAVPEEDNLVIDDEEWDIMTHKHSTSAKPATPTTVSTELRRLRYPQLKQKMLDVIAAIEDNTKRIKYMETLKGFESEEIRPSCVPCGSKAPSLMRLWLAEHESKEA